MPRARIFHGGNWAVMETAVRDRIHSALPLVKGFLDMTVTYVLSREWQDLLSIYIFRLHPLPHCTSAVRYSFLGFVSRAGTANVGPDCEAEASAIKQTQFALVLLMGAAMVQGLTHSTVRHSPHITEQITSIAGMCVGWGAGDAAVKSLLEYLAAANAAAAKPITAIRGVSSGGGTGAVVAAPVAAMVEKVAAAGSDSGSKRRLAATLADLVAADRGRAELYYAALYSVLCAMLIVLLHPLTSSAPDWGDHRLLDMLEAALFSLWSLATRALTTSVLMLWTVVSKDILLSGLAPEQFGSSLHQRVLFLWAVALTFSGAAVTGQLLRWQQQIVDADEDDKPASQAAEASWIRLEDAEPEERSPPPLQREPSDVSRGPCCSRLARRRAVRAAGVQVLILFEKVISWLAGVAWTDVFFATSAQPGVWLALQHTALAIALTSAVLAWLVFAGGRLNLDASVEDRAEIESYFVVQSASFFVGWSWVVVLRDVAALLGQAELRPQGIAGGVAHLLGLESVETVRHAAFMAWLRSFGIMLFFGPVLSGVVIWGKHVALRAYGRAGGVKARQRLLGLLAKAHSEDKELATRLGEKISLLRADRDSRKHLLLAAGIVDAWAAVEPSQSHAATDPSGTDAGARHDGDSPVADGGENSGGGAYGDSGDSGDPMGTAAAAIGIAPPRRAATSPPRCGSHGPDYDA